LLQLSIEHAASLLQSISEFQQAGSIPYQRLLQIGNTLMHKRVAQFAQQAVCEAQETLRQLSLSKLTHNHENVTRRAKLPLSQ
jgi:hypothetical protein